MMREKMEYYQKTNFAKEQVSDRQQIDSRTPLVYKREISPEEKKNIREDIHSSINLLEKILYETKQKSFEKQ